MSESVGAKGRAIHLIINHVKIMTNIVINVKDKHRTCSYITVAFTARLWLPLVGGIDNDILMNN